MVDVHTSKTKKQQLQDGGTLHEYTPVQQYSVVWFFWAEDKCAIIWLNLSTQDEGDDMPAWQVMILGCIIISPTQNEHQGLAQVANSTFMQRCHSCNCCVFVLLVHILIILPSSCYSFRCLIKKCKSLLQFVTYLLNLICKMEAILLVSKFILLKYTEVFRMFLKHHDYCIILKWCKVVHYFT